MKSKQEKLDLPKEFISDVTDIALFVRTSDEEVKKWDRQKITESLLRETKIKPGIAFRVASEVEKKIIDYKIKTLTAPLVRELVNAELLARGLEKTRKKYSRLGAPLYDVENIIVSQRNKDNANVPHGPEATNFTLAEKIKKEYALLRVFSQDVADAHLRGDLHLHDLGEIDRPYCSGQSLEYIKKFGLDLATLTSQARPAKHAEVLIAHLLKFSASLQCTFAGAIGWDAINLFLAPFLVGRSKKELKQLAQILIYEFNQQAVARGGQAIFSDINIYWEVPKHFADTPAIGPGGKYTGKKYKDYEKEAQNFAMALFENYLEGDSQGRPFFLPKPNVHMTEKLFQTANHNKFLNFISEVASNKGNTYYVFDRGETAKISECCRLSFKLGKDDLKDAKTPWKMRYSAMQNITINLPRIAYRAKKNEEALFANLTNTMELAAKAHRQKRLFIERLLNMGQKGPLAFLTIKRDGEPYYRLRKASHLIGMVGLNEMVQYHTGQQLHESIDTLKLGLKIIAHMNLVTEKFSRRYGLHFNLEQSPAETTAYRFAKLDYREYPRQALGVLKGNPEKDEIYYTNSTLLNLGAAIDPIERVKTEGMFHPLINAGSISHIWLGESSPPALGLANFVKKTFQQTTNDQIAFSPEFTNCNDCGKTARGLRDKCSYCSSKNIDAITRVTGYFSRTSMWNKGKIGELKDRYRNSIDKIN
ncbi:MAG: anaerobic ribonucleoside-triphosphate reductase [bacterium]